MTQHFDLIVIGAGPGGFDVAGDCADKGMKVAIIEKSLVGGTCLNRGCIPTKCLCASAAMLDSLRRALDFGIDVQGIVPSYARASERMTGIVDGLRDGVLASLAKCELIKGEARFEADGCVHVNDRVLSADKIIIATGSQPAMLPIPGADLALNSDQFLKLSELPESLVVIGGGVIGMELAAIANTYGCQVTVIEYCKEVLPPFDSEVAKRLRTILSRRGVTFKLESAVTEITHIDCGCKVDFQGKKGPDSVCAQAVLMAVGRKAVVPQGLADAGIEVDKRGFIITDANMETTRPGVFAVGDCNGRMMLAHVATAQAMVVMGADINLDVVPADVFTSPEVAMVGITGDMVKRMDNHNYIIKKALFAANGKAQTSGEAEGFVKIIYDADKRLIAGCHIIGPHAADLIQEAVEAMANGLTIDQMSTRTIHAHPTLSETLAGLG